MLFAFTLTNGQLRPVTGPLEPLSASSTLRWVDVVDPAPEELEMLKKLFDVEFGDLHGLRNIEASARFVHTAEGQVHLRAEFLNDTTEGPDNSPVQFVIAGEVLLSAHAVDLPSFRLTRDRAGTHSANLTDAKDVLLEIYATDAEYSADVLEGVHRQLRGASKTVLTREMTDRIAAAVLARIAQQEDLNGSVRHNLADTRRALFFLTRERLLNDEQQSVAREIRRDLDSLDAYTGFLFDKINFLMDATVGFVNVIQNNVIKSFSVAAVALLPPTLIASIYGMNFEHMPELEWLLGYPFALGLMGLSVVLPFWWFRRRGWLR